MLNLLAVSWLTLSLEFICNTKISKIRIKLGWSRSSNFIFEVANIAFSSGFFLHRYIALTNIDYKERKMIPASTDTIHWSNHEMNLALTYLLLKPHEWQHPLRVALLCSMTGTTNWGEKCSINALLFRSQQQQQSKIYCCSNLNLFTMWASITEKR